MNKQEAIEKIKNIDTLNINDKIAGQKVDMVIKNQVLDIVSHIDEPQKVTIPKFVADKIEYYKDIEEYGLLHAMDDCYQRKDSAEWLEDNQETFDRAWHDGYKVEQEKLYTVEIPNPNNEYSMNVLIRLPSSGKIALVALHKPNTNTSYLKNKEYQLTEAEIRKDFEWAWQWAKEV